MLFLLPPIIATAVVRLIVYLCGRTFLGDRWTNSDLVRLTLWSTVTPVASELLAAAGFERFYERNWVGSFWLVAATIALTVGTIRLRRAEGLNMRKVKSGEVYKRAFFLARQMKIPLREVAVVPVGRGNLTNAYGSSARTTAITENYTTLLKGAQLDSVIGHELGHVKMRHGIRTIGIMAVVFGVIVAGSLLLPRRLVSLRPPLDVAIVLGPVLIQPIRFAAI